MKQIKGDTSRFAYLEKLSLKLVVCNPCESSPSLTILVRLWVIIISLVFFYLIKLLLSGFLQFKGNFLRDQNNSKSVPVFELLEVSLFSSTQSLKMYRYCKENLDFLSFQNLRLTCDHRLL